MDNLTHSLVGLLCAEAVVRTRERASKPPLDVWTRTAVYSFAIIGNNLPDLDLTYSKSTDETFGYLLQHRGYTHTVPAAFGFALAMLLVFALVSRWRRKAVSPSDWWLLAGVALVSPLLHIAMDFANNYGVHPFWPLDDRWFYGDSLFILEPSLWLVLIAPLSFSYRSKWVRGGLWLVLGVALGALWLRAFVPRGNALVLTLLTAGLLVLARKQSPGIRFLLAAGGFALLGLAFVVGSRTAKAIARERAQVLFPLARTFDVVATPMPANPFCWSVILVQEEGAAYAVRLGRAATWPGWLSVSECPFDRGATPTAPLRSLPPLADARLSLTDEYRLPLADLRTLVAKRCEARAFFRFARAPYLTAAESDGSRVLGDLRYDRKRGLDFADIRLMRAQGECPEYVPPWQPPREDILSGGQRP
ncbi:MAG: metal-dependent hydrolase [Polyangiaceae bacterium]